MYVHLKTVEIYLIRHTLTTINSNICFGQSDVGLAPGEADLVRLIDKTSDIMPAAIYTSPLQRCRKIAEKLGTQIPILDERLKELHFGEWEMKPWNEIDQSALQGWMNDFVNEPCPGGESYVTLFERVKSFWHDCSGMQEEKVVVVTHAGVIRAWLALVLDLPLAQSFVFDVPHGSISRVDWVHNRFQIKFLNR